MPAFHNADGSVDVGGARIHADAEQGIELLQSLGDQRGCVVSAEDARNAVVGDDAVDEEGGELTRRGIPLEGTRNDRTREMIRETDH